MCGRKYPNLYDGFMLLMLKANNCKGIGGRGLTKPFSVSWK